MLQSCRIAITATALTLTSLPLAGCLAVAAAAGAGAGVAYVQGDLEATLEGSVERVAKATERALDDLKINVISGGASKLDAHYKARTAEDKSVNIRITTETEKTSKISIRIGTFGDEAMSRRILDEIKEEL